MHDPSSKTQKRLWPMLGKLDLICFCVAVVAVQEDASFLVTSLTGHQTVL